MDIKYVPIRVTRSDSGGVLWSVGYIVGNRDVEKGETPSYSHRLIAQRCEQLNRERDNGRQPLRV